MKLNHKIVDQNTDEWLNLRIGLVTASNFGKAMANFGKPFGNPAIEYAQRVAIEAMTGELIETYKNDWMQRGSELEPLARQAYEMETFASVQDGGFFFMDGLGYSPDGLVGDSGLIEIKSVKYTTHFERLLNGGYDRKYRWQIQGGLWLTGRDWCDFISYCPEMPENKQLYIYRVEPDKEDFKMLESRLSEFKNYINELKKILCQ